MRRILTVLFVAAMVFPVVPSRSDAAGQNPFDRIYGLSDAEQRAVVDSILEGRGIENTLRAKGRISDANELASILSDLEKRRYAHANPLATQAYAYVYSWSGLTTIHLAARFFDITKLNDRPLSPEQLTGLPRKARLEQLSFLIHEWKHTQYKTILDFGRPEAEAYELQYKWLLIFGITDDDQTTTLHAVRAQLSDAQIVKIRLAEANVKPDVDKPDPARRTAEDVIAEFEKERLAAPPVAKCESDYQEQVREIDAKTQWNISGLGSPGDRCYNAESTFDACYRTTCGMYRDSGIYNDCTNRCIDSYKVACKDELRGSAATQRDQCVARSR